MNPIRLLTLTALALTLTGCAFQHRETSRQLDHGEWVVGAALDVPGGLEGYGPYLSWAEARLATTRLSAGATYGILGRGDASLFVGTTQVSRNVGLSGRYYATDWLNVGLQTDFMHLMNAVTLTPRLATTTTPERWYYGGLQTTLFFGTEEQERFDFFGGTLGLLVGAEHITHRFALPLGLQAEAILSPWYYGQGFGLFHTTESTPGLYQIGLGAHLRF